MWRTIARAALANLWHEKLGWAPADDVALKRWGALHRRYTHTIPLDAHVENAPFPTTPALLDLGQKLRVIFLQAESKAQLQHDLPLLVTPADARAFLATLDSFEPRFHPWFVSHARPQIGAFGKSFAKLLRDKGLIEYVGTVAHFYGVPPGPHTEHIHLVALPVKKSETHGQQLGNHAVVECLRGELASHRIDVVLHEAFHFMYWSAAETRGALTRAFLASKDPNALAAYGLLNEVLATVLGNGIIPKKLLSPQAYAKYLSDPMRLYDDPFIGPVSKAMIPVVERRLAQNRPLDAGFVEEYLKVANHTLGAKIASPLLALRTLSLAWDGDALLPAAHALIRAVSPRSMWRSSPLDDKRSFAELAQHARLDGAILVLDSKLSDLSKWGTTLGKDALPKLELRAKKHPSFVMPVARPGGATVWVFVAPDPGAMNALVSSFVNQSSGGAQGH